MVGSPEFAIDDFRLMIGRKKEGSLAKTQRSPRFKGIPVLAIFLALLASWRE